MSTNPQPEGFNSEHVEHRITLLVEQIVSASSHLLALDPLKELRESVGKSISGATGIPIALKFLKVHVDSLTEAYTKLPNSLAKQILSDLLARLVLTFKSGPEADAQIVEYVLSGTGEGLFMWGSEFMRNVAGLLGDTYARADEEHKAHIHPLIVRAVNTHFERRSEPEGLDLLFTTGLIHDQELLGPLVTSENIRRVAEYMKQCAIYGDHREQTQVELALFRCFIRCDKPVEALRVALSRPGVDEAMVVESFASAKRLGTHVLRQMAHVIGLHGGRAVQMVPKDTFDIRPALWDVAHNQLLSSHFRHLGTTLELMEPRTPADVLKLKTVDSPPTDAALRGVYSVLGDLIMNGMVHAGFGSDAKLCSHLIRPKVSAEPVVPPSQIETPKTAPPTASSSFPSPEAEGSWLLNLPVDSGLAKVLGSASVGLLHLWDGMGDGLNRVDRYANSPDAYIRAGALFASGLTVAGTTDPTGVDPLFCLLGDRFNPFRKGDPKQKGKEMFAAAVNPPEDATDATPLSSSEGETVSMMSEACAILGLASAYCSSHNTRVADLLKDRLRMASSDPLPGASPFFKVPRSFASLALGMVMAGSADKESADILMRAIAGHSKTQRTLRYFPLAPIGLGLIFLRRPAEAAAFAASIPSVLDSVTAPDSSAEFSGTPPDEEQNQLAAYIQAILTVLGNAFSGDVRVLQDLLRGVSAAIRGRAAAEEARDLRKSSSSEQQKNQQRSQEEKKKEVTASSGLPVTLPGQQEVLWPGENMDPISPLTVGLGIVAGQGPLMRASLRRLIDRIIQFGSEQAKRAAPLSLAVTSLGVPDVDTVECLSRAAHSQDESQSFNAIMGLGLVGAGTNNSRVASRLRSLLSYHSTSEIHIFAIKVALGFLHMGKGTATIQVVHSGGRVISNARLAPIAAILLFMAPTCRVISRPKSALLLLLVANAIRPRFCHSVDSAGRPLKAKVRVGNSVDTVGLAGQPPSRLTGFQSHTTPVLLSSNEAVELATDDFVCPTDVMEDVVVLFPKAEDEEDEEGVDETMD
eukprot:gnl/Dysnectes_brevis/2025_a2335_1736.p1 GENE.gnl/Dysnectes_brevis/2025_a2335_1736~~gnl/Dysnectes_brevis/2025_a2335_1736.p1  ORF type:complete len:1034 (-),score=319.11 gnl/Dysnectes_brevis/2025_a2335_1736:152-3253(-)